MTNSPPFSIAPTQRRELERALVKLLMRYGATTNLQLDSKVARCVEQIEEALTETATDSKSLSPLDVVRIRLGKFAASLTPPAVFRDPGQLALVRAEVHEMALAFVGGEGAQGSRFLPGKPK